MRIAIFDNCRQDACAVREPLPGQEVKLYGGAESLLSDVEQERCRKYLFEEAGWE